jgi:hypothetical protein
VGVSLTTTRRGRIERLALTPPVVPADLILRLQKYRDLARVPAAIREAAALVAAEATALVAPAAVTWRGPAMIDHGAGCVTVGGQQLHSHALARVLGESTEAYVVVLTIGDRVEERARALFEERQLLESFLMDTAGWAAIEVLLRGVRRRLIERERAAGRSVTARLGPGHLDWSVAEQPILLDVFGDTPLPVRLNEAAGMIPQKSISTLFGVVSPRCDRAPPRGR